MAQHRIVFMGTPNSVLPILKEIETQRHDVIGIYTAQETNRRGRSGVSSGAIKEFAMQKGIPVYQPETLQTPSEIKRFRSLSADVIILAAYGKILPKAILEIPGHGCLNIHPSLLPRHRGATPVITTILEGDEKAGTTLFLMDEGVDTGPILAQGEMDLCGTETTEALTAQLFILGAELLRGALRPYLEGTLTPTKQPKNGVTVTRRLAKEDGVLNWNKSGLRLEREIRGYHPWPGSSTEWEGKRLQVIEAELMEQEAMHDLPTHPLGGVVQISDRPLTVGIIVRGGWLAVKKVKLEGKGEMGISDFLNGYPRFLSASLDA